MHKVLLLTASVALAGLTAACGSSASSAPSTSSGGAPASGAPATSAPPASGPTTSPASTPTVSSVPPTSVTPATTGVAVCASANLAASLGQSDGTAGTIYYPLVLTNRGPGTCTIQGYPGVSFVTGTSGQQLGAPGRRETGPAPVVTLGAGQSASATLGIVEAGNFPNCQITPAAGLRVYPPDNTAALYIPHTDQGCANTSVVTLTIRPFASS